MNEKSQENLHSFKPVQFLKVPPILPPPKPGKIPIAVQFIIPGLKLGSNDKEKATQIIKMCGIDIRKIDIKTTQNARTKEPATFFTITFLVDTFSRYS